MPIEEVPLLTTYTSQDGNFTIKIKTRNGSTGQLTCDYVANWSPEGKINDTQSSGSYGWVRNDRTGEIDGAPFSIQVMGAKRADEFQYAVVDNWTGAYQEGDKLRLSGSRSYVNSQGTVEVTPLGTQMFVS